MSRKKRLDGFEARSQRDNAVTSLLSEKLLQVFSSFRNCSKRAEERQCIPLLSFLQIDTSKPSGEYVNVSC